MVDPDFGGTYAPPGSTATFTNGSTTVTFDGTMMENQAIEGDHLFTHGLIGLIESVTNDETIELRYPWSGPTYTATEEWVLNKTSVARYDPSATQAQAREFLSFFRGVGTFYFVDGDEPDSAVGKDGQFALKVNSGPWKIWYKVANAWVLQGSPIGVDPQGTYNPATNYLISQWVSWQGSLWSSLQTPNTGHQPDLSPTYWRKELSGGDKFNVWSYDTDRPTDGELILKGYPKGVTFAPGLSESYAKADVAATGSSVFSVRKNGVQFATITFGASATVATFSCPSSTTFSNASDELTIVAPSPRDATLSGVGINLVGYREG